VARFAEVAREHNADSIRVIATSAARDANNSDELLAAIKEASGLKVEIISGEQEADWAFQGVTTDPELARRHLLLLDVGGGSTEFILGQGEQKHFRQSFPLGTVRLLEKFPVNDPPSVQEFAACRQWLKQFLNEQVKPQLEPAMTRETKLRPAGKVELVGVGGTMSILARMEACMNDYDRERIEATRLLLVRVRWHRERLWSLPLEERKKIIGLPPNRADVILPGVAIYEAVMEEFAFAELRVSTRGLRFAAVMDGV
jgi:exopolyphosphatase/guanosine-5'-triphosphate,3'-diphosphate pyrophosphatase